MPDSYDAVKLAGTLQRVKPEPEESDEWAMLPDMKEGYLAHARPSNKPVYAIHFVLGKDGYRSMQMIHLDSDSRFEADKAGQIIKLRFGGLEPVAVTIRGTNLKKLYTYIHHHRMPWVAQADQGRNFSRGDDPVVDSITVIPLEDIKRAASLSAKP